MNSRFNVVFLNSADIGQPDKARALIAPWSFALRVQIPVLA